MLTEETPIDVLDPGEQLRKRFSAFGVQAKKWDDPLIALCIEDVDRRLADGRESENEPYIREQLVKRHLLQEAMSEPGQVRK